MKIGFFDSGLGGLHIANAVRNSMPEYDYIYLGDTLHVPYGRRSQKTIHALTKKSVDYLFREHDCALIIVACNTASALALRRIQQEYLLKSYPERRVLGVIVPTLEQTSELNNVKRIGLIATEAMANSNVYTEELQKIDPKIEIFTQASPLLVPMIEHNGDTFLDDALEYYLKPLLDRNIDTLILGCTHYCLLKQRIKNILTHDIRIISQDEIIPIKLNQYLKKHKPMESLLTRTNSFNMEVTDLSESYKDTISQHWPELHKLDVKVSDI